VWVHDGRDRPLIVHITQACELFADTLPLIAGAVQRLLDEVGHHQEPLVVVFDRGGCSATVFQALKEMGIGWISSL
jgi:rhodanese-related sulfurtransferase